MLQRERGGRKADVTLAFFFGVFYFMYIKEYFDGCCEPKNPGGNMGFGAVIFTDGVKVLELSKWVKEYPKNSNNVAEYQSYGWVVSRILEFAQPGDKIEIFGDSKLVVEQVNGNWKTNPGLHYEYAIKAKEATNRLRDICDIKVSWIPREQNGLADDLSKTPMLKSGIKFKLQKG